MVIVFSLKLVSFSFSKILKFTLNIHVQNVIVFGLHLFSSQVINQKLFTHKYFDFVNQEKEFSKLKFILQSNCVQPNSSKSKF
jgi:hypothetical protein